MKDLISAEQVQARIDELAAEINEDFAEVELLFMIVILRGGCFFGTDLAKRLRMPVRLDYIRVTTYAGKESTGVVSLVSDVKTDLRGAPVLVIDDIVDTGFTMQWILQYLDLKKPGVVRVAALLDKPARREFDVPIDYLGFVVPNVFVAGYGLDGLDDTMANLPKIIAVEDTEEGVRVPARRARLPMPGTDAPK
jgi:hypoxanthine phosphoribosyltransferase